MAALTPEIAGDVIAACRESADEIVATLTRAFDSPLIGVTIEEATTYNAEQPPDGFQGAGLAIVFRCAEASAIAVLPESSGMLPDWYRAPDATGKSQLSTLAQELSMLLLPASLAADEFHVAPLAELAPTLARAELAAEASLVRLTLRSGEKEGQLSLLWPLAKHDELLPREAAPVEKPAAAPNAALPAAAPTSDFDDDLAHLPRYTRSFLKVNVPVSVNLASQKIVVQEILDLVPGAIIKFDKSCEDQLELLVCDQSIAAGEVVKVGDKFGLRIRKMILPQEQFIAIQGTMAS
jgi:flagellar motor switch protein FliN